MSVGAWRILLGRVPIFLLDTDHEANDPSDRELSHRLYAGGPDLRVRQEWILGVACSFARRNPSQPRCAAAAELADELGHGLRAIRETPR